MLKTVFNGLLGGLLFYILFFLTFSISYVLGGGFIGWAAAGMFMAVFMRFVDPLNPLRVRFDWMGGIVNMLGILLKEMLIGCIAIVTLFGIVVLTAPVLSEMLKGFKPIQMSIAGLIFGGLFGFVSVLLCEHISSKKKEKA